MGKLKVYVPDGAKTNEAGQPASPPLTQYEKSRSVLLGTEKLSPLKGTDENSNPNPGVSAVLFSNTEPGQAT